MKLLVPDVNGADCCCVLQKFVMVLDIPPSNMIEVRHRNYTEAERRFLDEMDSMRLSEVAKQTRLGTYT